MEKIPLEALRELREHDQHLNEGMGWRVTIHYGTGDHATNYTYLSDALKWSEQAIRQMGWLNRKHSKVTIERIEV